MSAITTHVLDTMKGRPAQGVPVVLELHSASGWKELVKGRTDKDGRVMDLLPESTKPAGGIYRLNFDTASYFKKQGIKAFYPTVSVAFEIREPGHYHVPLLLNPFGYTTYRGS